MVASDIRASVSLVIQATPSSVFDAWIDPALMEKWFFKSPTNRLSAKSDPRPGGAYSITEYADGGVIFHEGTYEIVDRPKRLMLSLIVPQHFSGVAKIEVEIGPEARGSRVIFAARGAGPKDAQQIWEEMLSNLAELTERSDR